MSDCGGPISVKKGDKMDFGIGYNEVALPLYVTPLLSLTQLTPVVDANRMERSRS